MKRLSFILAIILIFAVNSVVQSKISETADSQSAMKCTDCHSCELLTEENPCLDECPRIKTTSESSIPKEEGPGLIKMNKLTGEKDLYHEVLFPHRLHSEMSDTMDGCKTCHHYNHPGKIMVCETCHNKERKREDLSRLDLKGASHRICMDCHRELSGKVECADCHQLKSSQPGKTAEEKSHLEMKGPAKINYETPGAEGAMVSFYHNEHVELFGIECKTCHSSDGCIKCHDKRPEELKIKAEKEDFHQNCSKCHDTEDDCSKCHSDESREGFNHRTTGLILDEIHTDLECEICHEDGDYSRPSCVGCHGDEVRYPDIIPGELVE